MAQNLKPNQIATATSTILGRVTAGTGDVEQLTGTQATTLLDLANGSLKGLMSSSDFTKLSGIAAGAQPGTLTAIGVTTANGVSGTSSGGTTPNLTITLGAITPTSVTTDTIISNAGSDLNLSAAGAFAVTIPAKSGTTNTGLQILANSTASAYLDFTTNGSYRGGISYTNANGFGVSSTAGVRLNAATGSTAVLSVNNTTILSASNTGVTVTGNISATNLSGTNTGDQTTITGNAGTATALQTSRNFSISGGGITAAAVGFTGAANVTLSASVDSGHITLARMANLAANSIIGNNTGAGAVPLALSGTQVTAMLDAFTTGAKGLAPASGGGTTNFLRADGTWASPGGIPDGDKGDVVIASSGASFTVESASGSFTTRSGSTSTATTDSTGAAVYLAFSTSDNYRHAIKSRHNSAAVTNNALDFWLHKGGTDASGAVPTHWAATLDTAGLGINGQLSVFSGATLNASISSAGAASLKGLQVSAAGAAMVLAIPALNDGRLEFTVGGATIGSVGANGSAVTLGAAFGKTVDFAIAGTTIASIDSNSLDVNGSVVINGASSGLFFADRDGAGSIQLFNNNNAINFHNGSVTTTYIADSGEVNTVGTFVSTAANSILMKNGGASNPTTIFRNDGNDFYMLFSAAGTTPSATWTTHRPLSFNLGTGVLTSANGQIFGGGSAYTGNITLDNTLAVRFKDASSTLAYLTMQNDNNFVFYNTDATGAARAIWSSLGRSSTSHMQINVPVKMSSDVTVGHIGTADAKLHVRADATSAASGVIIQNRATTGAMAQLTLITSGLDYSDNRYAAIRASGGASTTLEFLTSNGAAPAVAMYLSAAGHLYTKDIHASRGDGTGVVYLNAADTRYLYYDGANYIMPGAGLNVNGSMVPTTGNSNTWSANQYFQSSGTFASGPVAQLQAYAVAGATDGAWMSFHRPSTYAVQVGLDTDNAFKIGGWSDGTGVWRMWLDSGGTLEARSMLVATTPNTGTTGGVRIKENAGGGSAILQFINNGASAERGYIAGASDGMDLGAASGTNFQFYIGGTLVGTVDSSGFNSMTLVSNVAAGNTTAAESWNGTYIKKTSGTTMTLTLPTSGLSTGHSFIYVNRVSGNVTISATNGMYKNGASSTATSGTLAFGGKVTIFHEGSGVYTVDGSGLT